MRATIKGMRSGSGIPVSVTFTDGDVIDGVLHVQRQNRFYFCHNCDHARHGTKSPNMMGRRYSWVFSYDEESDSFTEDVEDVEIALPNCKEVELSPRLNEFIAYLGNLKYSPWVLLTCKAKPFEAYTNFDLSEKPGFIKMTGLIQTLLGSFNKTVEVKFSRFAKTMVTHLVGGDQGSPWQLDDKAIECMYNDLVAFQSGSLFTLDCLSGQAILDGYRRDFYSDTGNSTLQKSCMSDKMELLGFYVENPCVRLAVLRSSRGVEARCLLWDSEDGTVYYDRLYYTQDWIGMVLKNRLTEAGHKSITDIVYPKCKYISVPLSRSDFEKYPYVDNFRFINVDEGRAYATTDHSRLPKGTYRVLVSTEGGFATKTIE